MSKYKVGDTILDKWGDIGVIKEINEVYDNEQFYQIFFKKTIKYGNNKSFKIGENFISGRVLCL